MLQIQSDFERHQKGQLRSLYNRCPCFREANHIDFVLYGTSF